jgi:hypothetical protein
MSKMEVQVNLRLRMAQRMNLKNPDGSLTTACGQVNLASEFEVVLRLH